MRIYLIDAEHMLQGSLICKFLIVHEALQKPEWRKAIEDEIHALEKNSTWKLTNQPERKIGVNGLSLSSTKLLETLTNSKLD